MTGMSPFRLLVSHEEAERLLLSSVTPVERTERITKIGEAVGRVLGQDVVSTGDVPPFDRAAMDGYAVRAEDTFGASIENEVTLRVVGEVHAGTQPDITVSRGTCVQVATGAPLPTGADAVVMVEYTERRDDNVVAIVRPVYPGANISRAGEDIRTGDVVLTRGTYLTPARVGVLAALGLTEVEVFQRPVVSVIPTGHEVVAPGGELAPGQIYDVNSYTLEAILRQNGATVRRHPIVEDDYDALRQAVVESLDSDLVVLSGGSSVGEKDMMVHVLEEMGEILFHGVQIKPGKPTLLAVVDGTPVLGMPGYPTSCLSNAYIFLVPAIRRLARLPPRRPQTVTARMAKRYVSSSGRKQFLTVRIENGVAHVVYKHSGAITSMSRADGYVILPVNLDVLEEGEEIEVTLFD